MMGAHSVRTVLLGFVLLLLVQLTQAVQGRSRMTDESEGGGCTDHLDRVLGFHVWVLREVFQGDLGLVAGQIYRYRQEHGLSIETILGQTRESE